MALTLEKIRAARERIAPYIITTPLLRLPALDPFFGCRVHAKAECLQTTGAFKLRGAMNKVLQLSEKELSRGVVAASSGNHGRGLAYAAKALGIPATIVIPDTAPQLKVDNILALGARVVRCGLSERFDVAERLVKETGAVMVPPYNDEDIMAGQGTIGLGGVLEGKIPVRPDENVCFVISGGSIAPEQLDLLKNIE